MSTEAATKKTEPDPKEKKVGANAPQEERQQDTKPAVFVTVSLHPSWFSSIDFDLVLTTGKPGDAYKVAVVNSKDIEPIDIDLFDVRLADVEPGKPHSLFALPSVPAEKRTQGGYGDLWNQAHAIFENQVLAEKAGATKTTSPEPLIAPDMIGTTAPARDEGQLKPLLEKEVVLLAKWIKVRFETGPLKGTGNPQAKAGPDLADLGFKIEDLPAPLSVKEKAAELKAAIERVCKICGEVESFAKALDASRTSLKFRGVSQARKAEVDFFLTLTVGDVAFQVIATIDLEPVIAAIKDFVSKKTDGKIEIAYDWEHRLITGTFGGKVAVGYEIDRLMARLGTTLFWVPDRLELSQDQAGGAGKDAWLRALVTQHQGASTLSAAASPVEELPLRVRTFVQSIAGWVGLKGADLSKGSHIVVPYYRYEKAKKRFSIMVVIQWQEALPGGDGKKTVTKHVKIRAVANVRRAILWLKGVVKEKLPRLQKVLDCFTVRKQALYFDLPESLLNAAPAAAGGGAAPAGGGGDSKYALQIRYDLDQKGGFDAWSLIPDRIVYYVDRPERKYAGEGKDRAATPDEKKKPAAGGAAPGREKYVIADALKIPLGPGPAVREWKLGDLPEGVLLPLKKIAYAIHLIDDEQLAGADPKTGKSLRIEDFQLRLLEPRSQSIPRIFSPKIDGKPNPDMYLLPIQLQLAHVREKVCFQIGTRIDCLATFEWVKKEFDAMADEAALEKKTGMGKAVGKMAVSVKKLFAPPPVKGPDGKETQAWRPSLELEKETATFRIVLKDGMTQPGSLEANVPNAKNLEREVVAAVKHFTGGERAKGDEGAKFADEVEKAVGGAFAGYSKTETDAVKVLPYATLNEIRNKIYKALGDVPTRRGAFRPALVEVNRRVDAATERLFAKKAGDESRAAAEPYKDAGAGAGGGTQG